MCGWKGWGLPSTYNLCMRPKGRLLGKAFAGWVALGWGGDLGEPWG